MCVLSMVADDWNRRLPEQFPWVQPPPTTGTTPYYVPTPPSREEFDALRREVEELRQLLVAAKRYDDATGQADCEKAEKVALLRGIAELVGVDLSEVLYTDADS